MGHCWARYIRSFFYLAHGKTIEFPLASQVLSTPTEFLITPNYGPFWGLPERSLSPSLGRETAHIYRDKPYL